jgi:hypothetical protein
VSTRLGSCGQAGHRARTRARTPSLRLALAAMAAALPTSAIAADDPFDVQVIESRGRTVTAELVDLDGDGREDLLQAVTFGMPPEERRLFRVHVQGADGEISPKPTLEVSIPPNSAAYDLADVDGVPGKDVLLLRPRGVGIVSFVRSDDGRVEPRIRYAQIPEDLTLGVSSDERGLDRLPMATQGFGSPPWLVVPGMVETFFLAADGALKARISSGARANYFVQPSGLMLSESDIQIFLDAPRVSVSDVDGDGRSDVVASQRHQLLIFLQQPDGHFEREPSRAMKLGRIKIEDHIRGSGAVRSAAQDIDGDGLADLIISETTGGVMDAGFDTYIFFNRGGAWDLDHPDYAFLSPELLGADQLIDIDGDGTLELMRIGVPITILELIEIFLTEAIDANLKVYGLERPAEAPEEPLGGDPWFKVKLGVPLDFETSRPAGFVPTVEHDFNGDGFRDYISSTDGSKLEVFVGSREKGYPKRSARQKIATEGQIRPGDLNGDGLTDLVLFNTRRDNQPVKLLRNRGELPGTVVPPGMSAQPK